MCQSIADGGQRCATHTRPNYTILRNRLSLPNQTLTPDEWSNLKVFATLHATTKQGSKEILHEIQELTSDNYTIPAPEGLVPLLQEALKNGLREREIIQETKRQIRIARKPGNKNPETVSKIEKRMIKRALTSIEVATTLGAEIPAPVGTSIYMVTITTYYDQDSSTENIGAYPTQELAEIGLANWIAKQWGNGLAAPWHGDHPNGRDFYLDLEEDKRLWEIAKVNYLNEKTPEDIIKKYFSQYMSGTYRIEKVVIKGN